ncbi:MAG: hypothetical protein CM15mP83_5140 [Flavobacteriaceae bacterium]|nr:MAG: hypothetical protein CM15mP83_5140 [Flavobacteriaceae bacterium]
MRLWPGCLDFFRAKPVAVSDYGILGLLSLSIGWCYDWSFWGHISPKSFGPLFFPILRLVQYMIVISSQTLGIVSLISILGWSF